MLAWEDRSPRLDQDVCEEEEPARASRGDSSVVHLSRMMDLVVTRRLSVMT